MENDQTKIGFAEYMQKCEEVLDGRRTLESLAVRECGDCTVCCTAPGIERSSIEPHELATLKPKAACEVCKHSTGKGCGIYQERPNICRSYQCLWLAGLAESKPSDGGVAWCIQPCLMTGSILVVGHALDSRESLKDVDVRKDIRSFLDFAYETPDGGIGKFAGVAMRDATVVVRFDNTGQFPHLMADIDPADPMRMEVIETTQRRAEWSF